MNQTAHKNPTSIIKSRSLKFPQVWFLILSKVFCTFFLNEVALFYFYCLRIWVEWRRRESERLQNQQNATYVTFARVRIHCNCFGLVRRWRKLDVAYWKPQVVVVVLPRFHLIVGVLGEVFPVFGWGAMRTQGKRSRNEWRGRRSKWPQGTRETPCSVVTQRGWWPTPLHAENKFIAKLA
jgi:hypothetical protein